MAGDDSVVVIDSLLCFIDNYRNKLATTKLVHIIEEHYPLSAIGKAKTLLHKLANGEERLSNGKGRGPVGKEEELEGDEIHDMLTLFTTLRATSTKPVIFAVSELDTLPLTPCLLHTAAPEPGVSSDMGAVLEEVRLLRVLFKNYVRLPSEDPPKKLLGAEQKERTHGLHFAPDELATSMGHGQRNEGPEFAGTSGKNASPGPFAGVGKSSCNKADLPIPSKDSSNSARVPAPASATTISASEVTEANTAVSVSCRATTPLPKERLTGSRSVTPSPKGGGMRLDRAVRKLTDRLSREEVKSESPTHSSDQSGCANGVLPEHYHTSPTPPIATANHSFEHEAQLKRLVELWMSQSKRGNYPLLQHCMNGLNDATCSSYIDLLKAKGHSPKSGGRYRHEEVNAEPHSNSYSDNPHDEKQDDKIADVSESSGGPSDREPSAFAMGAKVEVPPSVTSSDGEDVAHYTTDENEEEDEGEEEDSEQNQEKPFRCAQSNCRKSFTNKFLLKKHQFIHTGLRPHICPYLPCMKRFNRKDNLLRHKKTHLANAQLQHDGAKRRHNMLAGISEEAANVFNSLLSSISGVDVPDALLPTASVISRKRKRKNNNGKSELPSSNGWPNGSAKSLARYESRKEKCLKEG